MFLPKTGILETLRLPFGYLGHNFCDPGSRVARNGHTGDQMSIFIDFRLHLGTLLAPTLETFLWFFCDLGCQNGSSFQVHVFSDPGMEIVPESSGCMCYNQDKTLWFWVVSLFPLIHWFGVWRDDFRCHFDTFWWPWGHFFWFLRVLETGLKFDDF